MRQKVKLVTGPVGRLYESVEVLVKELNQKIEGWATYYGFGTSSSRFCSSMALLSEIFGQ